jgi:hypothetical protein
MAKPGINVAQGNNGAIGTKTDGSWYITITGRDMPTGNTTRGSKPGYDPERLRKCSFSRNALFLSRSERD